MYEVGQVISFEQLAALPAVSLRDKRRMHIALQQSKLAALFDTSSPPAAAAAASLRTSFALDGRVYECDVVEEPPSLRVTGLRSATPHGQPEKQGYLPVTDVVCNTCFALPDIRGSLCPCYLVRYCSTLCQKQDWGWHKAVHNAMMACGPASREEKRAEFQ